MKKILLLMMAIAIVTLSASATKIYVCGTKITGTTSFSAAGGTVNYDANTNTLTISNVDYTKTGSSNNGISVDEVSSDLTINLNGTVKFTIGDADAVLCKDANKHNTYINVNGTSTFTSKSSSHAGLKLQDCHVYLRGSGTLTIENTNSSTSANAIKGGTHNENLIFQIKNCNISSKGPRLYNLNRVSFYRTNYNDSGDYATRTTTIIFKTPNNGTVHASNITEVDNPITGTMYNPVGVHLFLPISKYLMDLGANLSSTSMANTQIEASDYVPDVIMGNSNFISNDVLRAYLLSLYPKGYLTKSESQQRKYLNISGMNINILHGIQQFKYLTELNCSNNSLNAFGQSISYLPSSLTKLNCSNNQISSLDKLPSNIEYLNCAGNKFTTLTVDSYSKLNYLDCSNNTQLTSLHCNNPLLITLLVSGCSNLQSLTCTYTNVSSLSSLPSSLKTIDVKHNYLTSLDVANCTGLTSLHCEFNQLTSLSLPSSLVYLYCNNNNFSGTFSLTGRSALKVLNIANNPGITALNCYENSLTSLSVIGCTSLTSLNCYKNQLTYLETLPESLHSLDCSTNKLNAFSLNGSSNLRSVFMSANPNLTTVNCYNNSSLTFLDVAACPALTTLNCYNNKLSTLSISNCTALTKLDCHSNQLTSLSNIPSSVQTLNCSSNKFSGTFSLTGRSNLKSLDISNNSSITTLNCYSNALTSLNVQNCSAMTTLDCHSNQLTTLGTLPSSLQTLTCSSNKFSGAFSLTGRSVLKSLDISSNPSITTLNCYSNALTSLNVSGCSAMTTLICNNNQLTSLDVSSQSNLTELNCSDNKLTSLNVSNKTKLTQLRTYRNQLTSLNVQGCTALTTLLTSHNKLSSLSVQGCNALRLVNCCFNQIKESGMGTLVNSLCTIPAGSQGELNVIAPGCTESGYTEANIITNAQVRAARNKRWIPKKWTGSSWVEIPVNTAVPGDVNGDGNVTSADITALYDVLLNNNYSHVVNGDQTGDGQITAADVTKVYTIMLGGQN